MRNLSVYYHVPPFQWLPLVANLSSALGQFWGPLTCAFEKTLSMKISCLLGWLGASQCYVLQYSQFYVHLDSLAQPQKPKKKHLSIKKETSLLSYRVWRSLAGERAHHIDHCTSHHEHLHLLKFKRN